MTQIQTAREIRCLTPEASILMGHHLMRFEMIARAAGRDAGNRSMRATGRTRWNATDYKAAAAEYNRLVA